MGAVDPSVPSSRISNALKAKEKQLAEKPRVLAKKCTYRSRCVVVPSGPFASCFSEPGIVPKDWGKRPPTASTRPFGAVPTLRSIPKIVVPGFELCLDRLGRCFVVRGKTSFCNRVCQWRSCSAASEPSGSQLLEMIMLTGYSFGADLQERDPEWVHRGKCCLLSKKFRVCGWQMQCRLFGVRIECR